MIHTERIFFCARDPCQDAGEIEEATPPAEAAAAAHLAAAGGGGAAKDGAKGKPAP